MTEDADANPVDVYGLKVVYINSIDMGVMNTGAVVMVVMFGCWMRQRMIGMNMQPRTLDHDQSKDRQNSNRGATHG